MLAICLGGIASSGCGVYFAVKSLVDDVEHQNPFSVFPSFQGQKMEDDSFADRLHCSVNYLNRYLALGSANNRT